MEVTKVVVCSLALAAFWWGAVRVVRRLMAWAPDLEDRRHVVDLFAVLAVVGSLVALVQARWWFDGSAGWPRRLVVLLYLSWLVVALASAFVALCRFGSMLFNACAPESRRMRIERNLGTVLLAAVVASSLATVSRYAPQHTRADEVFVLRQVHIYDRIAELRAAADELGSDDPAVARVLDLAIPTLDTELRIRRLFDRWDLADDPRFLVTAYVHTVDAGVIGLSPPAVDSAIAYQLADLTHWTLVLDTDMSDRYRSLVSEVGDDNARGWRELLALFAERCRAESVACEQPALDLSLQTWEVSREVRVARGEAG